MYRPALGAIGLFVIAANLANGQSDLSKIKPITDTEAEKFIEVVKKRRSERPFIREVSAKSFMMLANGLLTNESLYASIKTKYEMLQKAPGRYDRYPNFNGGIYRDYVLQTSIFYHTVGEKDIAKAMEKNPPQDNVIEINKLNGTRPEDYKNAGATLEYYFVSIASNEMKPITVESTPQEATIEIDDIQMTNNTNNVYFMARNIKHKVKFTLDKHDDHEVTDFDTAKTSELKVKLKAK